MANLSFKRKSILSYVHTPICLLRMYEARIFIEYQSHNATFYCQVEQLSKSRFAPCTCLFDL